MYGKGNKFVFLLTGRKDNDRAAVDYVRTHGYEDAKCVLYKLEYTPPYKEFLDISSFVCRTKYRPFCDPLHKKAIAAIDLSQWIGHEKEEYIQIFFKFLHDYNWSFYQYDYVFTVGDADQKRIKALYTLADTYLCEGEVYEDRTLTDEKDMSFYLMENFPVDKMLAGRLAHIFVSSKVGGYAQLHTVMEDFMKYIKLRNGAFFTEKKAGILLHKVKNCKLQTLFEKEIEKWMEEYKEETEKEEAFHEQCRKSI